MTDKPDITKHLAQQEAARHATGEHGVDAMLALISAQVTADAAAKKAADHAVSFRDDLKTFPADVVLTAARKHRDDLAALPIPTPDRQQALDDMDAFLSKF
jgi:hypothetical protein